MSELCIDFGYDDNVKSEIKQLTRKLDSRIDDYRGVRNSIAGIDSNTDNLYQANTYLDKKRAKLEAKTRKLERFKRAVTDFNNNAERIDKEVASGIKADYKGFLKDHGLRDGLFYTIGVYVGKGVKWLKETGKKIAEVVVGGLKKAWEWVQDFYEKHKYLIEFIVDVAATVASIITFVGALAATIASGGAGIPLLLAATWGLMKNGTSLIYSGAALWAHNEGNDTLAEELSGKGMKEIIQAGCSHLFGEELGGKIGSIVYHGLNIASFAVSAADTVKDAKYLHSVDGVADKYGDMLTPETIAGIQKGGKNLLIKITTGIDLGGGAEAGVKNISKILKIGTGFAEKGLMGMFGIGLFSDISGLYKDITSIFTPKFAETLPY